MYAAFAEIDVSVAVMWQHVFQVVVCVLSAVPCACLIMPDNERLFVRNM